MDAGDSPQGHWPKGQVTVGKVGIPINIVFSFKPVGSPHEAGEDLTVQLRWTY